MFNQIFDAAYFNNYSKEHFPEFLGIVIKHVEEGKIIAEMPVIKHLFAPNGFLHSGSIVAFADKVAGYSTLSHLPENGKSFTTLELKSNFVGAIKVGAIKDGILECESSAEHIGRTTQIWRVIIRSQHTKKKIAVFSCTQLILY